MEAAGHMMSSFNDDTSTNRSSPHQKPSKSHFSDDPTSSSEPCFDCSICLEFAVDPVVTLCGHLYCWSCIYKWLQVDVPNHGCPVCKSPLSHNSLVPLYGRGTSHENTQINRKVIEIPNRLAYSRSGMRSRRMQQDHHHPSQWGEMGVLNSTAWGVLGGLITAILPLMLRNVNNRGGGEMNFWRMNHVAMVPSSERERRVEKSLHQIWMLLFCCSVLWWLVC